MDKFSELKEKVIKGLGFKKEEEIAEEEIKSFPYLDPKELLDILGLTIKSDEQNKLTTFLCQLSAFTEDSQFNISFNAPSSTGKSYIPLEIAKLFKFKQEGGNKDVIELGYCSPKAFFHDQSKYDPKTKLISVDLERKILIFLDQPHNLLLQHLRPLLSHDKKEILVKITDKSRGGGQRTKNILIRGFPAVIFCSAGLRMEEQESTRFLLLSPEISQEKIRQSIIERLKKESDSRAYDLWLEEDPRRKELKERIKAIKKAHIEQISIPEELRQKIENHFLSRQKFLKPRHSRDISRLISLSKAYALLNLWNRKTKEEGIITCLEEDWKNALKIWEVISKSQELNLSPYIFELFRKVILPLGEEENEGISRKDISGKHLEVYGRPLPDWQLRQEILPMLEIAGLIYQEFDLVDKRKMLVKIIEQEGTENYSE